MWLFCFCFCCFFAAEKRIPSATAANSETCCLPLCNQCTTLQPIWTVPQETIIQWHTERLMWKTDLFFLQSTPNQLERFAADCSDSLDDWPFLRRYICAGADGSRDENTVFHSLSSPSSFWEEEGGWLARWDEIDLMWEIRARRWWCKIIIMTRLCAVSYPPCIGPLASVLLWTGQAPVLHDEDKLSEGVNR